MPQLDSSIIQSLKEKPSDQLKGRLQIGVNRTFDQTMQVNSRSIDRSEWTRGANGEWVWTAAVHVQGAVGMRLHFEDLRLPSGVKIVVHGPDWVINGGANIDAQLLRGQTDFWAETVLGENATVECHVPDGVSLSTVSFSIKELAHIYTLPMVQSNLKESACEIDVSCYPAWAQQASGVARMSFVDQGGAYLCTGCLLGSDSGNPDYFLTAHHCITSATVASTVELYWFYQTASCNGAVPSLSSVPHTSGGADLLATSSDSDFSFMQLRKDPPTGAAHLSWSATAPASGEAVTGIHHPGGTYKRISFGNFIGSDPSYWAVQWSSGVTEPGSSGSPLFNASGQVIGQLTGGYNGPGSSCADPAGPDEYGRFDVTYPLIQSWIGSGGGGSGGFPYIRATYNGLFAVTDNVTRGSCGSISLSTTTKGRFTGKVQFAMGRYSFSGQLDGTGTATITVLRGELHRLTLRIQIDANTLDSVSGTVTDDNWTANIDAQRVVYDGKGNLSPEAGSYTFTISGDGYGDSQPGGNSFGLLTVTRAGKARVTWSLADGTKAMLSSVVSQDSRAPVFIPLYSGHGLLYAWLSLVSDANGDVSGDVTWNKDAGANARYYPNGFGVSATLTGSIYTRPQSGVPVLDLTDGKLALQGGGLDRPVADRISFNANKVLDLNSNKLSLTFSAGTGLFKGRWTDPQTGQALTLGGIVLENKNQGFGFFMGAQGSGVVNIGE
jgi:hypothetical protein